MIKTCRYDLNNGQNVVGEHDFFNEKRIILDCIGAAVYDIGKGKPDRDARYQPDNKRNIMERLDF
jgi:hypothetical protein